MHATPTLDRRRFLKTAATLSALASLRSSGPVLRAATPPATPAIRKGIMWATVGVKGSVLEKMQAIRAAGIPGVEMMSHMNQDEVLKARDATGLQIPSVCGNLHWGKPLSDPDPKVRAEGLAGLEQTLRDAGRYGARSVLLVPAVVNKQVSYAEAWDRSQGEIRKALPLAAEVKVKIAIENVWNQFLLSPLEAARYLDEFNSPWVGWHMDIGNVINYGWPEQWIRILGRRIVTLHIKEFSRKRRDAEGLWKGFDVELLKGDDDWPAVMQALADIGFDGWGIAEQPGADSLEGMRKLSAEMDTIFSLPVTRPA